MSADVIIRYDAPRWARVLLSLGFPLAAFAFPGSPVAILTGLLLMADSSYVLLGLTFLVVGAVMWLPFWGVWRVEDRWTLSISDSGLAYCVRTANSEWATLPTDLRADTAPLLDGIYAALAILRVDPDDGDACEAIRARAKAMGQVVREHRALAAATASAGRTDDDLRMARGIAEGLAQVRREVFGGDQ